MVVFSAGLFDSPSVIVQIPSFLSWGLCLKVNYYVDYSFVPHFNQEFDLP